MHKLCKLGNWPASYLGKGRNDMPPRSYGLDTKIQKLKILVKFLFQFIFLNMYLKTFFESKQFLRINSFYL